MVERENKKQNYKISKSEQWGEYATYQNQWDIGKRMTKEKSR